MKKLILAGLMIAFTGIAGVVIADNENPVIANLVNNSGDPAGYMVPGYHAVISKPTLTWSDIAKACGTQESCNQIFIFGGSNEEGQIVTLKIDSARKKLIGISADPSITLSGNTITIPQSFGSKK